MGDFNNVLKPHDREGGNLVHENEYIDLQGMMENTGLFGIDSKGDKFMLSNKQTEGIIYTKIDRAIANVDSL